LLKNPFLTVTTTHPFYTPMHGVINPNNLFSHVVPPLQIENREEANASLYKQEQMNKVVKNEEKR